MDSRLSALRDWLCQYYNTTQFDLQPLAGDASFRRYFRVQKDDCKMLAVDMPPAKEKIGQYIEITRYLKESEVLVPHIYSYDVDKGFLLIEDFGDHLLSTQLCSATTDHLYRQAIDRLIQMQSINADGLPQYDSDTLLEEMEIFTHWYCGEHMQCSLNAEQMGNLNDVYRFLVNNALQQPQVFVHRDYHSRNLIYTEDKRIAVIDFQDAVSGPITYDLVSLLKDCYIKLPNEKRLQWIDYYLSNSDIQIDSDQFVVWFDLMGVQRHLKAVGIFARLYHRDHKDGYLKDIPRTLAYINEACENYPQLNQLKSIIQTVGAL